MHWKSDILCNEIIHPLQLKSDIHGLHTLYLRCPQKIIFSRTKKPVSLACRCSRNAHALTRPLTPSLRMKEKPCSFYELFYLKWLQPPPRNALPVIRNSMACLVLYFHSVLYFKQHSRTNNLCFSCFTANLYNQKWRVYW